MASNASPDIDKFATPQAPEDALAEMPFKLNPSNPAENLENLATAQNVQLQVTEPFSRNDG